MNQEELIKKYIGKILWIKVDSLEKYNNPIKKGFYLIEKIKYFEGSGFSFQLSSDIWDYEGGNCIVIDYILGRPQDFKIIGE